MIIKSKFTDYYDYVGSTLGFDPKIIYLRNNISGDAGFEGKHEFKIPGILQQPRLIERRVYLHFNGDRTSHHVPEFKFKLLIVCGKMYLLVSENTDKKHETVEGIWTAFQIFNPDKHPRVYKVIESYIEENRRYNWWNTGRSFIELENHLGFTSDKLIELCEKVNQPVFVIKEINYDRSSVGSIGGFTLIEVEDKIPKLKDIGFTSLVDPIKLFYDISFFMTNVLRDNPDVEHPVEVSDKDKIPQHGFDLKQSFRHRKE